MSFHDRSSSPPGDDNIVEWTEEEQNILATNMTNYPEETYSSFKRYTLLLTNLPHKRLRDVVARVSYYKELEKNS